MVQLKIPSNSPNKPQEGQLCNSWCYNKHDEISNLNRVMPNNNNFSELLCAIICSLLWLWQEHNHWEKIYETEYREYLENEKLSFIEAVSYILRQYPTAFS